MRPGRKGPVWIAVALAVIVLAMTGPAIGRTALAPAGAPPTRTISLEASGFYASPNPDDVGISATFYASSVCQAPTLSNCSYSYSGLPAGCSNSNSASLICTPSASGQYTVNATATWACPVCLSNSATLSFDVNDYPAVSSVTASPSATDAGRPVQLQVIVSGGSSPFGYVWSALPPGCSSYDAASLACTPTASGNYTIDVQVTDVAGGQTTGSVSLTVSPS
ncbi:MAG TPA: hypothetical protein VJS68_03470, partial [Thermoplasmata archaeon]|nr:hypothetical protein [Thermoplasmata archaeon]